ncbi:MAG: GGDEF domain-containing protein [Pseudomonadota bacterium]
MAPRDDKTVRRDIRDLLTASGNLKANFVVLAGADIGRTFPIEKVELIIGRGDQSDIFIDDEDVSRSHAKIEVLADAIVLKDLGSTNGTLVNGRKIAERKLEDGDRIQVGNLTVLKFNFLDNMEEEFNEQLYTAANKDFLTQIYNRKYFLDRLKMELSYARRHETPLSLLILDLDFFKKVNDKHGHLAGDAILKQLTAEISTTKRQEDLFARYGGEEFVLLLRGTPKETAIQIAEKLRSKVEQIVFNVDGIDLKLTVSIGLATFSRNNYKNDETFLRAADALLYRAKKEGRNRIFFSKEGLSDSFKPENVLPA